MTTKIAKRSAEIAPAIPVTPYGVRLPGRATLLGADTLAQASDLFLRAQRLLAERSGWSRILRGADVFDLRSGTPVLAATISQNGKVWAPGAWTPGALPLHDPTGGAL